MLHVWVHGWDQGRVSNGSRLALYQTLSIECPSSIFFWRLYFVIVSFFLSFLFFVLLFFCSRWSFVDVPLIFFCPADHVPNWQPRILLGMVEARSVDVKKTTATKEFIKPLYSTLSHETVVAYPWPAILGTKRTNQVKITFDQQAQVSRGHTSYNIPG